MSETPLNLRQVRYLISKGIVSSAPNKGGRGQTRQFSERDLHILDLAATMNEKGISITKIHPAVLASILANWPSQFYYANDDPRNIFAILWTGRDWEIEKSVEGIIRLYEKAVSQKYGVFYGNSKLWEEVKNARSAT